MFLWRFFAGIARAVLPEATIKKLRGDRKSVHARWVLDPRERIHLFFHKLRGGSYLTWYARRQDQFALGRRDQDPSEYQEYLDSGIEDLDVIKKLGVQPNNSLHEFGCGYLRSARFFIEYLDKGKFSANDTSAERINFGIDRWKQEGLNIVEEKAPFIVASQDNSFNWMDGRKVDFIWCHAVFGHMPPADIEETVANMKKVLEPHGAIIFTYGPNPYTAEEVIRTSVKDWYHSLEFFQELAEYNQMTLEECDDEVNKTYPNDDVLIMRLA